MKALANMVLFIISLTLSLVFLEWASRMLFGIPNPLPIDPNENRSFISRPLSRGEFPVRINESHYDNVPYQISSLGLRDREYAKKRTNEIRVALVGDSMAMGWGLLRSETVSRQLERLLQSSNTLGHIQVINAGQFGYGPAQELSMLEETVGVLEPDIVILQLFMGNDLADSARAGGIRLEAHSLDALLTDGLMSRDSNTCYRINRWLRETSRAYQQFANSTGNAAPICSLIPQESLPSPIVIIPNADRPDWLEVDLKKWYPELNISWEITKEGIRGIRQYCRDRGIKLFVYVQPSLADVSLNSFYRAVSFSADTSIYEHRKGIRLAEKFLRAEHLMSVDILGAILAEENPEAAFYLWDGHLTPNGAKRVAKALYSSIVSIPIRRSDGVKVLRLE